MAYSETIKFVSGDTRPILNITIKDSNTAAAGQTLDSENSTTWAAIDLSTATAVKLLIRKVGESTFSTITGSPTDAAAGKYSFTPIASTFPSAGTYEGEIEIEYNSGTSVHSLYDLIKFQVREDFN